MFLTRDNFGDLFRQINRMQTDMGTLFSRPTSPFNHAPPFPPVNVWEDENAVYAEVDLAGADPEKIDVSVTEGNRLVIQGEHAQLDVPNAVWHRHERPSGSFSREFTLPIMIDSDRVAATYQDGVLRIELPKAEAAKPRKIAVKSK